MQPALSNPEIALENKRRFIGLSDLPAMLGIIAGLIARWILLGDKSFWFDEGLTSWMIGLPVREIIRMCRADVAAPLYFILCRYWAFIFGTSEAALRSLSTVFATGSMLLFFLFARRILIKPLPTAAATWLFAFSAYQVEYAKEARFYALLSFWLLLALYCLHIFLTNRSRWAFAGIVLSTAASLYTQNVAVFYLVALNLFWLLYPANVKFKQRLLDIIKCDALIGLLWLPWVPTVIQQNRWAAANFWATQPTIWDLLIILALGICARVWPLQSMVYEQHWDSYLQSEMVAEKIAVMVVALGAIPILLAVFRRRWARIVLALTIYAMFPITACYIKSLYSTPIFMGRIFIGSGTILPLLIAIPLADYRSIWTRLPILLLVAVILFISIVSVYAFCALEPKEQWRDAYQLVSEQPRDGTLVVFVANEGQLPFDYYASRDTRSPKKFTYTGCPQGFFDLNPPQTVRRVTSDDDLARLKSQLASGQWKQVVLIYSHEWFADPDRLVPRFLENNCYLMDDQKFEQVEVMRFTVPSK